MPTAPAPSGRSPLDQQFAALNALTNKSANSASATTGQASAQDRPSLDDQFSALDALTSGGPRIESPEEAQGLARLILQGRITGAARTRAIAALRAYDATGAEPPSNAASNKPQGGFLHDLGLLGRDVAEGAAGVVTGPHDLEAAIVNPARRALDRLTGTQLWRPYSSWQAPLSNALTSVGLPVPSTAGEKLAAGAIRGATGALTGAGLLGLASGGASSIASIPNLIRAGLAGTTGGAGSEMAREAGGGPYAQLAVGLAGALAPGGIERLGGVVPRLVRPFTVGGQEQLAANVLAQNATEPATAAAALQRAKTLVPGSLRTSGEASGDTGLLALEKGIRARNAAPFAERVSQQNAARQEALTKLGKTEADVEKAEAARDAETAPMREAAFARAKGVPMTLYRGQQIGGTPGFDQGGAIWTTPDREIAQNYANNTLGNGPGSVERYDVVLRRPFVSTPESAEQLSRYIEGPEATPEALANTQRWLENEGLESISPEARQRLLSHGYDSVIVHNETLAPEGQAPSVVLLKSPEQMRAPTVQTPSKILDAEGNPVMTEKPGNPNVEVQTQPVVKTIDGILDSPQGAREAISKTMKWAKGLIGDRTDPESLYEVRKDLELAQRGKLQPTGRDAPNESMLAQTRGQLGQVISALDDAIEKAAPGYKAYLARYRELSQPINQMEAIQDLQKRASNGYDTATGQPFLSAPQFTRRLAATLEREKTSRSPLAFSPLQRARLAAIREDAQRGSALSSPTVRAPGSDTFQNFMTGNRLSRLGFNFARHLPGVGRIAKGIGEHVDKQVNERLADAMLNPGYAAQLLARGRPQLTLPQSVALALARGRAAGAIGSAAAARPNVPLLLPAPVAAAPLVRDAHRHHADTHGGHEVKPGQWAALVLDSRHPALLVHHGFNKFTTIYPPSYPGATPDRYTSILPRQ